VTGALLYDLLIYTVRLRALRDLTPCQGADSPVNRPWEWSDLGRRWRRAPYEQRALGEPEAKQNMPAGNAGPKV